MNRPCAFWCYLFSAEPGVRKGAKREKKGCSKTLTEFLNTPFYIRFGISTFRPFRP